MVKEYKFVRLEEETHTLLDAIRKKDETYNKVVLKLLALSHIFDNHKSVKAMIAVEKDDDLFDLEEKERDGIIIMGEEDFQKTTLVDKRSKIGKMMSSE